MIETPRYFLLRVATDLSRTPAEATGFYRLMSSLACLPSSPTLFNSGNSHPQLSSCFLIDSPRDDLGSIYDRYAQVVRLGCHGHPGRAAQGRGLRVPGAVVLTLQRQLAGTQSRICCGADLGEDAGLVVAGYLIKHSAGVCGYACGAGEGIGYAEGFARLRCQSQVAGDRGESG